MPWDEVMHKWKTGTLKSGGSGKKVKSQEQAVAIMLSEKRAAQHGKKEYAAAKPKKLGGMKTFNHFGQRAASAKFR
jgi:hypothetical protein